MVHTIAPGLLLTTARSILSFGNDLTALDVPTLTQKFTLRGLTCGIPLGVSQYPILNPSVQEFFRH